MGGDQVEGRLGEGIAKASKPYFNDALAVFAGDEDARKRKGSVPADFEATPERL